MCVAGPDRTTARRCSERIDHPFFYSTLGQPIVAQSPPHVHARFSVFCRVVQLEQLDLSGNRIESFAGLKQLTNLQILRLARNGLSSFKGLTTLPCVLWRFGRCCGAAATLPCVFGGQAALRNPLLLRVAPLLQSPPGAGRFEEPAQQPFGAPLFLSRTVACTAAFPLHRVRLMFPCGGGARATHRPSANGFQRLKCWTCPRTRLQRSPSCRRCIGSRYC